MIKLNKNLFLAVFCVIFMVLAGCNFQARSLQPQTLTGLEAVKTIQVKSTSAELKLLLSKNLQNKGFVLTDVSPHYTFVVHSESSSDAIHGIQQLQKRQVSKLTYSINFEMTKNNDDVLLPAQTRSWTSYYSPTLVSPNVRDVARITEIGYIRSNAAEQLTQTIVRQVLSEHAE